MHLLQKKKQGLKNRLEMLSIRSNEHIIVIGNQKSGTSAIAALLAEMTGLSSCIDLKKEITQPSFHRVKKGEISFKSFVRANKQDFKKKLIKEPNLTLLYDEINRYFYRKKVVFIVRDPRDNIRSILNRLKIPGNIPNLTNEYRSQITPAWDLTIDGSWFGLEGCNYIEMLAARWNYMADVYLKNQDRMQLVRYEDFLEDKVGELKNLATKLNLIAVKDVSDKLNIQFQPKGDQNVKWLNFFGKENLSLIESICEKKMNVFY